MIGALAAGWLTWPRRCLSRFRGRPNPPSAAAAAPKTRSPRPPTTPAPVSQTSRRLHRSPRRRKPSLGFPIYPNAQFIASYDAGRGQRYYLFGSELSFAALVKYYQTVLKNQGHAGLRGARHAHL